MQKKDMLLFIGLTVILTIAVSMSTVSLTGYGIFDRYFTKITVQKAPSVNINPEFIKTIGTSSVDDICQGITTDEYGRKGCGSIKCIGYNKNGVNCLCRNGIKDKGEEDIDCGGVCENECSFDEICQGIQIDTYGRTGCASLLCKDYNTHGINCICQNGIKNSGEEGVDCGGVCEKECKSYGKPQCVFIDYGQQNLNDKNPKRVCSDLSKNMVPAALQKDVTFGNYNNKYCAGTPLIDRTSRLINMGNLNSMFVGGEGECYENGMVKGTWYKELGSYYTGVLCCNL